MRARYPPRARLRASPRLDASSPTSALGSQADIGRSSYHFAGPLLGWPRDRHDPTHVCREQRAVRLCVRGKRPALVPKDHEPLAQRLAAVRQADDAQLVAACPQLCRDDRHAVAGLRQREQRVGRVALDKNLGLHSAEPACGVEGPTEHEAFIKRSRAGSDRARAPGADWRARDIPGRRLAGAAVRGRGVWPCRLGARPQLHSRSWARVGRNAPGHTPRGARSLALYGISQASAR